MAKPTKPKYQPVHHDQEVFLAKAMGREGFKEAYKKLDEKYAPVRKQLAGLQSHGDGHEKPR
ncbi:MAG: hypothetical protein EHM38_00620 [Geobacteraceae bacterium]|nr:MAG: hypothetical protein EHM38_07055 [Geobacteraceae bacterium]RPI73312.1 MAG: hypothetical protein EHM38_00620 [Geobacteraceae bacterium]